MDLKHPASHTRDVALFLPFRKSLGLKQSIPLPQLIQQFMNRRIGASFENPVSICLSFVALDGLSWFEQIEQARAALDLFRSVEWTWETMVARQTWPCDLPPSAFAQYFT
jgi:RNA exonuclease 4